MHQNPDLRAVYGGRGFSHSRNFLFLCLLECFIFFCCWLFCFLLLYQFRILVIGLITPIQRIDSSERHRFYYDFTTSFAFFVCLFFFLFFVFSSCGMVFVFNTRCCFSVARCQNYLINLINEILHLSCHQLSSSFLSLSDLVLKASSLKDK